MCECVRARARATGAGVSLRAGARAARARACGRNVQRAARGGGERGAGRGGDTALRALKQHHGILRRAAGPGCGARSSSPLLSPCFSHPNLSPRHYGDKYLRPGTSPRGGDAPRGSGTSRSPSPRAPWDEEAFGEGQGREARRGSGTGGPLFSQGDLRKPQPPYAGRVWTLCQCRDTPLLPSLATAR